MNTTTLTKPHIDAVPFEITVYLGEDAATNRDVALHQARHLAEQGESVVYVNSCFSMRKINRRMKDIFGTEFEHFENPNFHCVTSPTGNLIRKRAELKDMVRMRSATTLIINSWEFASKNHRYKEDLIFLLRELCEDDYLGNMTIIVYSQAKGEAKPGIQMRGGIGKLACCADAIHRLPSMKAAPVSVALPMVQVLAEESEERLVLQDVTEEFEAMVASSVLVMPEVIRGGEVQQSNALPDKPIAPMKRINSKGLKPFANVGRKN